MILPSPAAKHPESLILSIPYVVRFCTLGVVLRILGCGVPDDCFFSFPALFDRGLAWSMHSPKEKFSACGRVSCRPGRSPKPCETQSRLHKRWALTLISERAIIKAQGSFKWFWLSCEC